jgi:hypothetical protein
MTERKFRRAYQIDIEKPGVRVSHLTTGFFIALLVCYN